MIPADRLPYGMEPDLYTLTDDRGNVEKLFATVEAGHDGSILANLAAKYGRPAITEPNGVKHWTDAHISVMYKPATKYSEGMIVVATKARLLRERQEQEEAQNRKL